ncbi:MAG TPA: YciI family protein [Aggregatilineales bacterium]|nr:YciI family protein [Aggregatilineales bacterium]
MRYMFLIYTSEAADANATPAERDQSMKDYDAFGKEAEGRGLLKAGDALHPTTTATTLRVRDGKALTTDGPYAETKEQLGGFYILNCKDINEALEMGGKIPGAKYGFIEIRPIMEFN